MNIRAGRLLTAPLVPTLAPVAAPDVFVMVAETSSGLIGTYFVSTLGTDVLAGMAQLASCHSEHWYLRHGRPHDGYIKRKSFV